MILCTYHGNYHCFIFHILGFLALRVIFSAADVSAYAVDAMRWAVGCGYLKGSGAKLNPQTGANRAEVAVLLPASSIVNSSKLLSAD